MSIHPVDEAGDDPPGVPLAILATCILAVPAAILTHPWMAWLLNDWSWRSWIIPAAEIALAAAVAVRAWRRCDRHPIAYPALMALAVLQLAALLAWRLS
jgi:hypothetical protein